MMQLEQQVGIPELACDARQLAEKLPGDVGLAAAWAISHRPRSAGKISAARPVSCARRSAAS